MSVWETTVPVTNRNGIDVSEIDVPEIDATKMDLSKEDLAKVDLPKNDLAELSIDRLRLKLRYKVLYHLGRGCADVDDLVQESLVRFFRAEQRKLIRNTEEFGAFLNGVCRNVILEYRRRRRREPPLDPDVPIPDPGVRPDADIFEMRNAIDSGLAELAERDRAILRSLYLEGREKEDICREWGMTDAQFRVVLFRAKERFRRVYDTEMKRSTGLGH